MGELFASIYKDKSWQGRYVAISADLIQAVLSADLPASAMTLVVFIALNDRSEAKDVQISYSYIQKGTGLSSATVSSTLARLLELKIIERVGRGYRVRHWRSLDDWKASAPLQKLKDPDHFKNQSETTSKTKVKPLQKSKLIKNSGSRQGDPEGGRREEGTADADAGTAATPALPLRVIEGSKVTTDKAMAELQEEFQENLNRAIINKSSVLRSSYFNSPIPASYSSAIDAQLLGSEAADTSARTNFLRATNAIISVWKHNKVTGIPMLPVTASDVRWLGDIVAAFVSRETPRSKPDEWVQGFSEFYSWCLSNKPNLSYNLLGHFFGDWQRSLQTGSNRASR